MFKTRHAAQNAAKPPTLRTNSPCCCKDINTETRRRPENARMHISDPSPFRRGPQTSSDAASFDAPLTLLHACHDRVHARCDLLRKLWQHMGSHGADQQAQDAACNILRYFDLAAPLHHEDEERHIFPRLLASGNAELVQCARTLLQQHQDMAAAWSQLRPLLLAVQQGQTPDLAGHADLIEHFVALYRAHIELEEQTAFPAGFAAMSEQTQAQIGDEMAARRGATRPASPKNIQPRNKTP